MWKKIINETSFALTSKSTIIVNSTTPKMLASALGAGGGSFAALFFASKVVGLSAAGAIVSGDAHTIASAVNAGKVVPRIQASKIPS